MGCAWIVLQTGVPCSRIQGGMLSGSIYDDLSGHGLLWEVTENQTLWEVLRTFPLKAFSARCESALFGFFVQTDLPCRIDRNLM